MRITKLLKRDADFNHFCLRKAFFDEAKESIIVDVEPRKNSRGICPHCGKSAPGYDTIGVRLFEYTPLWGFPVKIRYAMRRVECPGCGAISVEKVPWADGKSHLCHQYAACLADWSTELPWKSVARRFRTSWQTVRAAVSQAVSFGLSHRELGNVSGLGVDEVAWHRGHNYLTLVYQTDAGKRRLLWAGTGRTRDTLETFFKEMGRITEGFADRIRTVCSDMWRPYLDVVAKRAPRALNILDRFHVMQMFGRALDKIRSEEAARLKEEGRPALLSHSRWCFLKRRENLTEKQGFKLAELLKMNLKTVRAYLLKEQFQKFWGQEDTDDARLFLDQWIHAATASRISQMAKLAQTLQRHRGLLLNYFRSGKQFNSGVVEGMNRKVNLAIRKAYGFKSLEVAQLCLYQQLGDLPTPQFTHRFW